MRHFEEDAKFCSTCGKSMIYWVLTTSDFSPRTGNRIKQKILSCPTMKTYESSVFGLLFHAITDGRYHTYVSVETLK